MPDYTHVLDPYPVLIKDSKDRLADLEKVVVSHRTSIKLFLASNPGLKSLREQAKKLGGTKEERAEALENLLIGAPEQHTESEVQEAVREYQTRLASQAAAETEVQRQKTEIERIENEFKVERYKLREATSKLERENLKDELEITKLRAETARLTSNLLTEERSFPTPIVL